MAGKDNRKPRIIYKKDSENKGDANEKSPKGRGQGGGPKFNFYWIYGLIALFFLFMILSSSSTQSVETKQFITMLENQEIKRIVVLDGKKAEIFLTDSAKDLEHHKKAVHQRGMFSSPEGPDYVFTSIGDYKSFEEKVEKKEEKPKTELESENK